MSEPAGARASAAEAPALAIEGLTVALPRGADRRHAVEDLSLALQPREILCLVGESGSGKSVTAHSVMGLLPKGQLTPVSGPHPAPGRGPAAGERQAPARPALHRACR